MTNELITCLEQKTILLIKILDITKQIEVRCIEPDVDLEDFLITRGSYISRVDMLRQLIERLVEKLPEEEKLRVNSILSLQVKEQDCNEEELIVLRLAKNDNILFSRAAAIDKSANAALTIQLNLIKEKMRNFRKKAPEATNKNNVNSDFRYI